jgi:TRAP-type C4-dicarboxylate transport system substrate-binding protein
MALTAANPVNADTWRYAHEEYPGDVQDIYAQAFSEYIESHSKHTLKIYHFGQLGESDDIMAQTKVGALDFVNQSPGFTGAQIPEAQIFFIPYLLPTDYDTVARFFRQSKAINRDFPQLYAKHNLTLLSMYPEGKMVVTIDEPFTSLSGLKDKKMRVMTNPLLAATYSAFGAIPTPLPTGKVYGALQSNLINGQENPLFWIESEGLYEVSPNLVFTGHGWFTTAVMANQTFFNALPRKDQQLIRRAADYAFEKIIRYVNGLAEKSLARIKEASDDVTVTRLTPEQTTALRARAPRVEARFVEMTGESGKELLNQFKEDLKEIRGGQAH